MSRFAGMILCGMTERGHKVESWTSRQTFGRLPIPSAFIRKWLGYADQFLVYPRELRQLVNRQPSDTLFVVTDQALGMWVPCFAHRPHVIHCHDFLALKSALGEFSENPTGWTGRQYQQRIRKGFSRGKTFISVSEKTREDLHRFLPRVPKISEVVRNGLNHPFRPMEMAERISLLKQVGVEIPKHGFIVHIGGNQWYKNRRGVLEIYRVYVHSHPNPLELWMIGAKPSDQLLNLAASIPKSGKVHFLSGLTNEQVNAAYSHARVLLFPSLEEGFGWPIVEAMACGTPVIATDRAPMREVGGSSAYYIHRMNSSLENDHLWAVDGAKCLQTILNLKTKKLDALRCEGLKHVEQFAAEKSLDCYERIYQRTVKLWE
jgi:glycosyltransferase involved in cell wall biosynthesis